MNNNEQLLSKAFQQHQAGNLILAERGYRQLLHHNPACAEGLHLLGLLTHQLDNHAAALDYISQAISVEPLALFFSSRALVYRETGQLEQAAADYRQAAGREPENVEVQYALGVLLNNLGQFAEAAACFQQALRLNPTRADAAFNLGVVSGRPEQLGRAEGAYRQAVKIQPDYADAWYNLAVTLKLQEKIKEAAACFKQALRLEPHKILWQLEMETLFPLVMPGNEAIEQYRSRIEAALKSHPPAGISLETLMADIGQSNAFQTFHLNYQGRNDLAIKIQYAHLFSVSDRWRPQQLPNLNWEADQRPRVGFVVTGGHEGIFLKIMGGILKKLPPDEFSLMIICPNSGLQRFYSYFDNKNIDYVTLLPELEKSVQKIRDRNLDLVYYWEAGSDSLNYFLPFFRLAPVQCTSWGAMATTGIPRIDYFISSRYFEPAQAEAHYAERLVQLDSLLTYFYRPALPEKLKGRREFELAGREHVYICPQSLLKLHPEFDSFLAGILRRDPLATVLLFSGKYRGWQERLQQRWQQTMPDVAPRIRFLPRQSYADYLNLLAVSDVMLDTIHFNGGTTTYEGLAVGIPIVTLPTQFMRGRMTQGCYQRMGMMDCVAANPQEYIDLALKLGADVLHRKQVKSKIRATRDALFEDNDVVRAWAGFFNWAVAEMKDDD